MFCANWRLPGPCSSSKSLSNKSLFLFRFLVLLFSVRLFSFQSDFARDDFGAARSAIGKYAELAAICHVRKTPLEFDLSFYHFSQVFADARLHRFGGCSDEKRNSVRRNNERRPAAPQGTGSFLFLFLFVFSSLVYCVFRCLRACVGCCCSSSSMKPPIRC